MSSSSSSSSSMIKRPRLDIERTIEEPKFGLLKKLSKDVLVTVLTFSSAGDLIRYSKISKKFSFLYKLPQVSEQFLKNLSARELKHQIGLLTYNRKELYVYSQTIPERRLSILPQVLNMQERILFPALFHANTEERIILHENSPILMKRNLFMEKLYSLARGSLPILMNLPDTLTFKGDPSQDLNAKELVYLAWSLDELLTIVSDQADQDHIKNLITNLQLRAAEGDLSTLKLGELFDMAFYLFSENALTFETATKIQEQFSNRNRAPLKIWPLRNFDTWSTSKIINSTNHLKNLGIIKANSPIIKKIINVIIKRDLSALSINSVRSALNLDSIELNSKIINGLMLTNLSNLGISEIMNLSKELHNKHLLNDQLNRHLANALAQKDFSDCSDNGLLLLMSELIDCQILDPAIDQKFKDEQTRRGEDLGLDVYTQRIQQKEWQATLANTQVANRQTLARLGLGDLFQFPN